jgi:hypothetical protein
MKSHVVNQAGSSSTSEAGPSLLPSAPCSSEQPSHPAPVQAGNYAGVSEDSGRGLGCSSGSFAEYDAWRRQQLELGVDVDAGEIDDAWFAGEDVA